MLRGQHNGSPRPYTRFLDRNNNTDNNNSVALVLEQAIPTERPLFVSEVSVYFCGWRVLCGQHNGSPRPYTRFLDRNNNNNNNNNNNDNNNSVALVLERTIPTERPLFVGEVSVYFCG
jgi:hypothetical protein